MRYLTFCTTLQTADPALRALLLENLVRIISTRADRNLDEVKLLAE